MNGSAKVRVFNAAGQLVSDDNTPSLNGYLMELKQPAGVYILRIETENGVVSQRIGISE
jgi:hypothetical protein